MRGNPILSRVRWVGVALGAVSALGTQAAFETAAQALGVQGQPWVEVSVEIAALLLGGFVAGSFSDRWQPVHGAFAATAYIFVSATVTAVAEASTAQRLGLGALPPLDFPRLAGGDLLALTAATVGGWLSARSRSTR